MKYIFLQHFSSKQVCYVSCVAPCQFDGRHDGSNPNCGSLVYRLLLLLIFGRAQIGQFYLDAAWATNIPDGISIFIVLAGRLESEGSNEEVHKVAQNISLDDERRLIQEFGTFDVEAVPRDESPTPIDTTSRKREKRLQKDEQRSSRPYQYRYCFKTAAERENN